MRNYNILYPYLFGAVAIYKRLEGRLNSVEGDMPLHRLSTMDWSIKRHSHRTFEGGRKAGGTHQGVLLYG